MIGPIASIIGILGVIGVLFLFANQLDKEYAVLRLIVILFGVTILLLVPKAMIDAQTVCETIVTNSTEVSSTVTAYEYEEFCYQRPETTPSTFWKVLGTFYAVFLTYIMLYLMWVVVIAIRKRKRKR